MGHRVPHWKAIIMINVSQECLSCINILRISQDVSKSANLPYKGGFVDSQTKDTVLVMHVWTKSTAPSVWAWNLSIFDLGFLNPLIFIYEILKNNASTSFKLTLAILWFNSLQRQTFYWRTDCRLFIRET